MRQASNGKELTHMPVKVQIVFYSLYGHIWKMAEAVAEGARQVPGAQVELLQVAETLPNDVLAKMGAVDVNTPPTLPTSAPLLQSGPVLSKNACICDVALP